MSISKIFDISSGSLDAYSKALDVTANNIANSSNPDYSRQTINLQTEIPQQLAGMVWGSGVKIADINRVRNSLTDSQIRTNNQKFAYSDTSSTMLNQVQSLFSEPSDQGLSNLISNFFNSWQQLAVTPNSTALRQNVIYTANQMANKAKNITDGLNSIKGDIVNQFSNDVKQINNYLSQIQGLNAQIFTAQSSGATPNDLMDQRDKLIDNLSKLVNINVTTDNNNSANISIGGILASDRSSFVQFSAAVENGALVLKGPDGTSAALTGGSLYALSDVYTNKLPSYQSSLDQVMQQIVGSVNAAHSQGSSITDPPQTGINFFNNYQSGSLTINKDILNDPAMIAISADGTSGNGDLAVTIGNIADQKVLDGKTISDSYSELVSKIGNDTSSAKDTATALQLVLNQLNQQKASYSGVSVDEEMTNVIKFQRSYDASAKLIKVADEMLQTLIEMV